MRHVLSMVVFLFPTIGNACTCAWQNASEWFVLDQLCASDTVFVGEVESKLTVRDQLFEYKIWPRESFKGQMDSPVFAVSETAGMCGYPFDVQGRYLIFANRREETNYLSASICGLTRPIDRDDYIYSVLVANKDDIDEVCGDEAVAARRLERLREEIQEIEDLQEATRELQDETREFLEQND